MQLWTHSGAEAVIPDLACHLERIDIQRVLVHTSQRTMRHRTAGDAAAVVAEGTGRTASRKILDMGGVGWSVGWLRWLAGWLAACWVAGGWMAGWLGCWLSAGCGRHVRWQMAAIQQQPAMAYNVRTSRILLQLYSNSSTAVLLATSRY